MLLQVLSSPLFYLLLVGAVWITRLAIQHVVRGAVDHQFALRIEDHKHELQRIAEQERFDLQRRLAGASLYLQKQHAAAAEVYAAVRVAHGFVVGIFAPKQSFILDDCNEADLRKMMADYKVLEGKQEELLAKWRYDFKQGAKAIAAHFVDLRMPRALNELQTARNLIVVNGIYFSDAADAALAQFVGMADEWIRRAMYPPERDAEVAPLSREDLDAAIARVHSALRAELSDPPSPYIRGAPSGAAPN